MGIELDTLKHLSGGWSVPARCCDCCKTAASAVFCRVDSAFLCLNCDAKIHGVNKLASRHERVWMCEVCEQAPAAVTCKADAAVLCVTCDSDIHSANPLARRHERVPVEPFYDSSESVLKSSIPFSILVPEETDSVGDACHHQGKVDVDMDTDTSWLLSNQKFDVKPAHLYFSETDQFLDFEYPNSIETRFQPYHNNNNNSGSDRVVPVQTKQTPITEKRFEIDFGKSKISSFTYPTVSSSSIDVSVVPDESSISEMSYSFGESTSNGVSGGSMSCATANQAVPLCGVDREARVMRYREKRKNRKFEKTIRYASRKAYAETRPRIKGRFAKRTEVQDELVDRLYGSSTFFSDDQYGVVPSFCHGA